MQRQVQLAKDSNNLKKIRSRVALLKKMQHFVVHRFHRAGDKEASRVPHYREIFLVLKQMLNLDGDVVCESRKFAVHRFHKRHGMPNTIEKIRIAERDVLRS